MTPTQTGVICFALCVMLMAVFIPALHRLKNRDEWYEEGWNDCYESHNGFAMSEEDKRVLKELKSAVWAHLKATGYQRSGDKKKLDQIGDIQVLKAYVWETCIYRREHERMNGK